MAKKKKAEERRNRQAGSGSANQSEGLVQEDTAPDAQAPKTQTTVIDPYLDVADAIALHRMMLDVLDTGHLAVEMSEGRPTQPALQLLVAASRSAASGKNVVLGPRAAAVMENTHWEGALK